MEINHDVSMTSGGCTGTSGAGAAVLLGGLGCGNQP